MTQLARGFSFVLYEHDAANPIYTLQFPFLDVSHVRVFAGEPGDAVEITTSCSWTGPTTLRVPATTPDGVAIPDGMTITIRRFTPRDAMMVNFKDGAQLPADDLNTVSRQLLYVMQESIDFGSYGGSGLPGGGTGWADTNLPTDPAIQQIIDTIEQSDAYQVLTQQIGDVDTNAEVVLQELLRSNDYFDTLRQQGNSIAKVISDLAIVQTEAESAVTKVDGVFTRLDAAEASVLEVQQAISTETDARAADITQVRADFASADDALNTAITTMVAETYATPDQATAIAQTKVDALANGAVAHIEERFDAMAAGTADPDGAFSAVWSVRINAAQAGGKPVIAGIGLGVDPKTGSSFIIQADQFAIIHPNYTAGGTLVSVKYPFVVGTVGGQTQVGIDGNLVVDGTITANKVKVTSLSAISANMGTVNSGTFRTYNLDANGNIINPSEFRVELTNNVNDSWPLWIGSGVKNANNAVFWVDRAGNGGFKGTVTAPNIVGQLQKANSLDWSGTIYSATTPNATDPFTLDAPVRLGEAHTPVVFVTVEAYNTFVDAVANGYVVLQKQVGGGSWVDLKSSFPYFGKQEHKTITMIVNDSPTSAAVNYRVLLKPADLAGFQVTSVSFFGMGFR